MQVYRYPPLPFPEYFFSCSVGHSPFIYCPWPYLALTQLKFSYVWFICMVSISRSPRDASVSAFQVFDWESFAVTVRHHCLQPKNFDSNIEASILSSTSIYFSFVTDGEDDVDTPCWIQLDVLPALEQGQGNVTQGKGHL